MANESYADALRQGQQKYVDALRAGQEAWTGAIEQLATTWSQTVQQATRVQAPVDAAQVIDQVFDFAVRMLEGQRQFAKSLAQVSTSATESLREQAGDAARSDEFGGQG